MEQYTLEQRLQIIKIYYQSSESVATTLKAHFFEVTKLIFGSMALSTSKICVIGQAKIHMCFMRHNCIPKKSLYGVAYMLVVLLGYIHVTVNENRYRTMITDYFWQQLQGMDLDDMWFQQDGATCHTAHSTIDLLKSEFGERVISRNGPVDWPPRSCDLTPLDYFLWSHIKSLVYTNKPATLGELRANIEREITAVSPNLCEKVVKNWVQRLDFCKRARGGHAKEIEFHT